MIQTKIFTAMDEPNKFAVAGVETPDNKMPDRDFDLSRADKESAAGEATPVREAKTGAPEAPAVDLGTVAAAPTLAGPADETLEKIENILEEDLEESYFNLPTEKKEEFKKEGEKTAVEISGLLSRAKIRARKIFGLIQKWLRVIPGINKFFLDQEAKIKTDEILDLAESEKNKKF